MRRIFCGFLASMAALLCPLAGCSKKTKNESRINSDFETVTKEDIVGITTEEIYVPEQKPIDYTNVEKQCVISEEADTSFAENINRIETSPEELEFKKVNIPEHYDCFIKGFIGCKLLVCVSLKIVSDAQYSNSDYEFGIYDTNTDEFTGIGETFSKMYLPPVCFPINDECFGIQAVGRNAYTRLFKCDLETGEMIQLDGYDVNNYEPGAVTVGEHGIASYYCERFSGDWVVRYCPFENDGAKEIFRYKNENTDAYPAAVISDGNNIALVIQYTVDGVSRTVLQWITPEGELLESEAIPLYETFGKRRYDIVSANITGDYYCFTAAQCDLPDTAVFRREGDTFYPVSMGDYLSETSDICCTDGSLMTQLAYETFDSDRTEKFCGAARIDVKNKSLTVCEIPMRYQDDEPVSQSCYITPSGEFITICSDQSTLYPQYEYAVE